MSKDRLQFLQRAATAVACILICAVVIYHGDTSFNPREGMLTPVMHAVGGLVLLVTGVAFAFRGEDDDAPTSGQTD